MGQAKIEPANQVEALVYVTILRLIWKIFQLLGLEEDECLLLFSKNKLFKSHIHKYIKVVFPD